MILQVECYVAFTVFMFSTLKSIFHEDVCMYVCMFIVPFGLQEQRHFIQFFYLKKQSTEYLLYSP
jgi:hypothetical protein